MRSKSRAAARLLAACAVLAGGPALADGQVERSQDGLSLTLDHTLISVVALRDDVLRVRIGPDGRLPPDESWAALPAARHAHAHVTPVGQAGFSTRALTARLDPVTGALTVTDKDGRPILANAGDHGWRRTGASSFRIDLTLGPDQHLFGLGDKMGPLDRRGRLFSLWNTDAFRFQESSDPLYKSIPFFIGVDKGRSFGVFMDNTWRSVFDFGASQPDVLSFGADGGSIDYYIFAGPEPKDVVRAYGWLTGTPPLPPLWAFGFQQSRHGYGAEAEWRAVAERLRADRIPSDVLWYDIDTLDGYRAFTTNSKTISDFKKMVADFDRMGLKSVVITDLHLAAQPGYGPYDSGMAGDHFLKRADGSLYVAPVWPGPSVFPDFTRAQTRAWWGGLYKDLYDDKGVAGFWNDMNEPAVFKTASRTMPADVVHRIDEPGFAPRTATHAEIHNVYGMLNSRATYDGLLALQPNRRPFVMTRATYAGGQRYGVTWTGDNSATWNHMRLSTPQLVSLGLGGFAFAGVDLGGYAGTPSPELLTQWIALGMFNPIARDHSSNKSAPQELWVHGPAQEALRRSSVENRYRLMPYIYTLAEEASRTGVPMMRPLFLEFPHAGAGAPLDLAAGSEFMWGPAMLVAPSPWPESPEAYEVTLPPGDWYDYWTGAKVAYGKTAQVAGASGTVSVIDGAPSNQPHQIKVTPALGSLPVYVRAGSIIPTQPLVQSTAEKPDGPLHLQVYPGPDCAGEVYADDGVSFDYRRGLSFHQSFTCSVGSDGAVKVHIGAPQGRFAPWWTSLEIDLHGAAGPLSVESDGHESAAEYDAATKVAHIVVPSAPVARDLLFKPR